MDYIIILLFVAMIYFCNSNNILINTNKINNMFTSSEIDSNISKLKKYEKYNKNKYKLFLKNINKLDKYINLISNEYNLLVLDSMYKNINKAVQKLRYTINDIHEISYSIESNNEFKQFNNIIKEIYNYYYKLLYKYIKNYNRKFYNTPFNSLSPININAPSIDLVNNGDYTIFNNEQPYNNYSNNFIY